MWKYMGEGDYFVIGLPARDLTDEEVKAIGEDYVARTGLYQKVEPEGNKAVFPASENKGRGKKEG